MRRAALALAALVAWACGPGSLEEPPEILWGEDLCGHCRMIVSEPAYAAALRRADGSAERFDDLGCLVRFLGESGEVPARIWLHDQASDRWLPAAGAWLVESPELVTPMGSGLAAFAAEAEARSFHERRGGRLLRWEEALEGGDDPDR